MAQWSSFWQSVTPKSGISPEMHFISDFIQAYMSILLSLSKYQCRAYSSHEMFIMSQINHGMASGLKWNIAWPKVTMTVEGQCALLCWNGSILSPCMECFQDDSFPIIKLQALSKICLLLRAARHCTNRSGHSWFLMTIDNVEQWQWNMLLTPLRAEHVWQA